MKHDCDTEIRANGWAMSGHRQTGDLWSCSCGKTYVHQCDEAAGCAWVPADTDYQAGKRWWNALTESERSLVIKGHNSVFDAWKAFGRPVK